jgi:hypothetical protein
LGKKHLMFSAAGRTSTPLNRDNGEGIQFLCYFIYLGGKGKAIPLQAWTGPEGSRRLITLKVKILIFLDR